MKVVAAISVLLIAMCLQCQSTELPTIFDIFMENGEEAKLLGAWGDNMCILQHYFIKEGIAPPREISDRKENYRNYVEYWSVSENKLFLKKIIVKEYAEIKPFDLSRVFESGVTKNGRFADWFTGPILVLFLTLDDSPKEYRIMYFTNGVFTESQVLTSNEMLLAVNEIQSEEQSNLSTNAIIVKKYLMYGSKQNEPAL